MSRAQQTLRTYRLRCQHERRSSVSQDAEHTSRPVFALGRGDPAFIIISCFSDLGFRASFGLRGFGFWILGSMPSLRYGERFYAPEHFLSEGSDGRIVITGIDNGAAQTATGFDISLV